MTTADPADEFQPRASLARRKLRERDLRHRDLSEADLRDADLRDADLSGAILTGADLRGADLFGAKLAGVHLNGVRVDSTTRLQSQEPAIKEAIDAANRVWLPLVTAIGYFVVLVSTMRFTAREK